MRTKAEVRAVRAREMYGREEDRRSPIFQSPMKDSRTGETRAKSGWRERQKMDADVEVHVDVNTLSV